MKKPNLLVVTMLALLGACCSPPATVTNGVPNLRQVDPGVWRCGQATPEGAAYLKTLGATDELKLNLRSEGPDFPGFKVHYHPLNIWDQWFHLSDKDVLDAVAEIKPGTVIHCEHGEDRTGLICAVYRVTHDHWTKADAEKEMLANGFHKDEFALWDWWKGWKP